MPGPCVRRVFLYQAIHAPVLRPEQTYETVQIDKWLQPFSEPVRSPDGQFASKRQARLPVQEQPTGSIFVGAAPFQEVIFESKWHQGWSTPSVLAKLTLRPALQWPMFLGQPPPLSAPAADNWLYPFSDPVRKRPALPVGEHQAVAFTPAAPFDDFPVDRWLQPLSEPRRERPRLAVAAQLAFQRPSAIVPPAPPSWGGFMDGPTFKYRMQFQVEAWNPFTPPPLPVFPDSSWSSPVQLVTPWKTAPVPLAFGVQEVAHPAMFDIWCADMPRPRLALGIHHVAQPYFETQQFTETVSLDRWMQPFSWPIRRKPALPVAVSHQLQMIPAATFFINLINPTSWLQPFSVPVRQPKQWARGIVQTVAYAKADTFTEISTPDKWFAPWTDPSSSIVKVVPVESKVALSQEGTVTLDKWFNNLSEPVRVKPALRLGTQPTAAFIGFSPFGENIGYEKWGFPLSIPPSLAKPGLAPQLQMPVAYPVNTTIPLQTYPALSEPVRLRPRAAFFEFTVAYTNVLAGPAIVETVPIDKWLQPWSEPQRQKIGTRSQQQVTLGLGDERILADKWFVPLTEPVRKRPTWRQGTQLTLALTQASPFIESVQIDKWLQPLSLPPRLAKRRLLEGLHQSIARTGAAPFGEAVLPDKWFAPLSEPKRFRSALHVSEHPYSFRHPDRPAGVVGFLIVTEGPQDTAAFTTVFRTLTPNPAAGAKIVVSELDPTTPSPVSVTEQ